MGGEQVDASTGLPHPFKRRKIDDPYRGSAAYERDGPPTWRYEQYTIAWICALHMEMAAACAMLDEVHEDLPRQSGDSNAYKLGSIGKHNVVIACLPTTQYGTNNASNVMTHLIRTFPSVTCGLMVGVGGGVPSKANIRLGDIVVGTRVMQHDLGKLLGDGKVQSTAIPRTLPSSLGTVVSALRSKHEMGTCKIPSILRQKMGDYPDYSRPDLPDHLFQASYNHKSTIPTCKECDLSKLASRSRRGSDNPIIHYGAIGSGNQVIRDASVRDDIARRLDVICFEMEAAGLTDICPCISIRGICDYSDSHKNKEWQRYAAATAAAYAREFLETLPASEARSEVPQSMATHMDPSYNHRKQFLDSLKFDQIHSRRHTIKSTQGKTCRWFLNHPDYQAWLDPKRMAEHHGFLWIRGKPGAGKSTMMKFAYNNMQKSRRKGDVVASFFFNARGEHLEKSMSGMYRSLLLQLLEGFPDLQKVLDDPDLAVQGQYSLSLITLKEIFRSAVAALEQRPFTCFVDALDECDEQQVMDMVEFFEELAEQATESEIPLRTCFSSRHYPYIDIRQGRRLTLEDQLGHGQDLASYVKSRLRISDTALVEELQPQILEKAAGVFMWVVLVVDILNKENRRGRLALKTRLAEVPSGLSDLFKDILRRDSENMEDLLLSILWILYAKRPLKPNEYYHALWAGLYPKSLADPELPDVSGPDAHDRIGAYVISSSKGLAEITKSKDATVQFIHESVRDFLIKDKGLQELWPDFEPDWEGLSHERLKDCCASYVRHYLSNAFLRMPEADIQPEELEKHPFLQYCTSEILYHANAAVDAAPQDAFLSELPLLNFVSIWNFFEKYRSRKYTVDASLLYVLCDKGYSGLIRVRLKQEDPFIRIPSLRYQYPLFAAIASGHKDAVAAVLNAPQSSHGDVDLTEGLKYKQDLTNFKERTPLSWASQEGRAEIVKLLLQQGACANEQDRGGERPLTVASNESVVSLLMKSDAVVNCCNARGASPLLPALENRREAVTKLLIDNGADVDVCSVDLTSPLTLAVHNDWVAIAKLLIEHGAIVQGPTEFEPSPLQIAVHRKCEPMTKLLIQYGADVDFTDRGLFVSLWVALREDRESMAKLLIENGVNLNREPHICRIGPYEVFWQALVKDYEAVAKLLIENGVNLNREPLVCETTPYELLWLALVKDYEAVAKLLIENGADINHHPPAGDPPLLLAIINGRETVASLLIEKGANVNAKSESSRFVWLPRTECGGKEILRLWEEKRSEIIARNLRGKTALEVAVSLGQETIARLLIEKGASFEATDTRAFCPPVQGSLGYK